MSITEIKKEIEALQRRQQAITAELSALMREMERNNRQLVAAEILEQQYYATDTGAVNILFYNAENDIFGGIVVDDPATQHFYGHRVIAPHGLRHKITAQEYKEAFALWARTAIRGVVHE